MNRINKSIFFATILILFFSGCLGANNEDTANDYQDIMRQANDGVKVGEKIDGKTAQAVFLHHSTGEIVWKNGTMEFLRNYNFENGTRFNVEEVTFPKESPYGWNNFPFDYWNIWVNHAGNEPYLDEPTLEILTQKYDLIILKHCFPVSNMEEDNGRADIASSDKKAENYKLQYQALEEKMRQFANNRFLVFTGAARVKNEISEEEARRARDFFTWVKNDWDVEGDNIQIFDFYELQTEGGLYFKDEYAVSSQDSHPNEDFARKVAPILGQEIISILNSIKVENDQNFECDPKQEDCSD